MSSSARKLYDANPERFTDQDLAACARRAAQDLAFWANQLAVRGWTVDVHPAEVTRQSINSRDDLDTIEIRMRREEEL